jgi:hypothetical protein
MVCRGQDIGLRISLLSGLVMLRPRSRFKEKSFIWVCRGQDPGSRTTRSSSPSRPRSGIKDQSIWVCRGQDPGSSTTPSSGFAKAHIRDQGQLHHLYSPRPISGIKDNSIIWVRQGPDPGSRTSLLSSLLRPRSGIRDKPVIRASLLHVRAYFNGKDWIPFALL